MNLKSTKNIVSLLAVLLAGTSIAYGMDEQEDTGKIVRTLYEEKSESVIAHIRTTKGYLPEGYQGLGDLHPKALAVYLDENKKRMTAEDFTKFSSVTEKKLKRNGYEELWEKASQIVPTLLVLATESKRDAELCRQWHAKRIRLDNEKKEVERAEQEKRNAESMQEHAQRAEQAALAAEKKEAERVAKEKRERDPKQRFATQLAEIKDIVSEGIIQEYDGKLPYEEWNNPAKGVNFRCLKNLDEYLAQKKADLLPQDYLFFQKAILLEYTSNENFFLQAFHRATIIFRVRNLHEFGGVLAPKCNIFSYDPTLIEVVAKYFQDKEAAITQEEFKEVFIKEFEKKNSAYPGLNEILKQVGELRNGKPTQNK